MNHNADVAAKSMDLSKSNFLKLVGFLHLVPVRFVHHKKKSKFVREAFYSESQIIAVRAAHDAVYKRIMAEKEQRAEG